MNYLTKGYYDFNGETSLSYTYAMCMAIKYIKQIEEVKTKNFSEICLNENEVINEENDITKQDISEMVEYLMNFD